MKYRTSLLAYVLIIALFFAAGYGAGMVNGINRTKEELAERNSIEPTDAVNASALADEELPEYMVVIEGSALIVYKSENGDRKKLTECEISELVYPSEDISALKDGMIFNNKNEAMAMFENFAS